MTLIHQFQFQAVIMSSTQPPEPKRLKVSHSDASSIAERLSELGKSDLEKLARAGIVESEATLNLARDLLDQRHTRVLHCVRCHEDYDRKHAGHKDCVMEEHDEDGLSKEAGPGTSFVFKWSCCGKSEDDSGPCYEGPHMHVYGEGSYWRDDELEEMNEDGFCSKCNREEHDHDGNDIEQRIEHDGVNEIIVIDE
jgi:hypothetical protein